jgi:DNA-binding transcriptional ArsR family regulator
MIDQIRRDIQARLDQLLAEADKLRHALTALGSSDGASPSEPAPAPKRAAAKPEARRTRASARPASSGRAASGATKSAVLEALSGGKAMTAGEVASATGLGRASVSTTLSKLAKSGEVAKADRGYQLKKS